MAQNHTNTINRQRRNAAFLVTNKPAFKEIKQKITHEGLNLFLRKWIAIVKLAEELEKSDIPCPDIENDTCKLECALPIEFGLPCKCSLYHCLISSKPIASLLIHPRWFLDEPAYFPENGWRMSVSDFQADNQMPKDFQEKKMQSDRYQEHGMVLLEESAIASLDYAKTLLFFFSSLTSICNPLGYDRPLASCYLYNSLAWLKSHLFVPFCFASPLVY